MSDSRAERIREVFDQAVELEPEQRASFLEQACQGDAELRAKVEELLAADAELDEFLEPPAGFGLPTDRLKADAESFLPEEQIGGYKLLRELGRGGRGVVYLAEEPESGHLIALKVLGGGYLPSAQAIERFRREGRSLAELDHPGIVKLVRTGEDPAQPYMAIEYIKGRSLGEELILQRHAREGGELPEKLQGMEPVLPTSGPERVEAIVTLVGKISAALAHAHQRLIIHRDLKPQNILLTEDGEPCVIDFGLADKDGEPELTITGEVEGTPNYMSPEQVRAAEGRIDDRTDVYSLGVVLYELLTLKRPFEADTDIQIMQNITGTVPPRIRRVDPDVPRALELICNMAMEKQREHRYQAMEAMRADLAAFLAGRPIKAKGPSVGQRCWRNMRRRPLPWVASLAIAVTALSVWLGMGILAHRAVFAPLQAEVDRVCVARDAGEEVDYASLLTLSLEASDRYPGREQDLQQQVEAALDQGRQQAEEFVAEFFEPANLYARSYFYYQLQYEGERVTDTASFPQQLHAEWARFGIAEQEYARFDRAVLQPRLIFELAGAPPESEVVVAEYRPFDRLLNRFLDWRPLGSAGVANHFAVPERTLMHVRYRVNSGERFECTVPPMDPASARICRLKWEQSVALDMVRVEAGDVDYAKLKPRGKDDPPLPPEIARLGAYEIQRGFVSETELQQFLAEAGVALREDRTIDRAGVESRDDRAAQGVNFDLAVAYASWRGCSLPTLAQYWVAVFGLDLADWPEGFPEQEYRDLVAARAFALKSVAVEDFAQWFTEEALDLTRNSALDNSASGLKFGLSEVWTWTMNPRYTEGFESMDTAMQVLGGGHSRPGLLDRFIASKQAPMLQSSLNFSIRCARSAWIEVD